MHAHVASLSRFGRSDTNKNACRRFLPTVRGLEARTLMSCDPPVAADGACTTLHDRQVWSSVYAMDPDGATVTVNRLSEPSHGTLTMSNGFFCYTPEANFVGTDSFTFAASNEHGSTLPATETIIVTNTAPNAGGDGFSMDHDTTHNGMLYGIDPDSDALSFRIVGQPSHGSVYCAANGSFAYTPAANYHGTDSFSFVANDGVADSNTATITIDVSRFPITVSSHASVQWKYQAAGELDWLAGENSASLSLSAVSRNGLTFDGPPSVTPTVTDRWANSHTLIQPGTPVCVFKNSNGSSLQGYTSTLHVKWTYSRVFLINAFGASPGWLDSLFLNTLNVSMETKITLTIWADGSVDAPVVENNSDTSAFVPTTNPQ